jgi:hypothetical protein
MTKFLKALGKDPQTADVQEGEIDFKDQRIKVLAFTGLQGKKLKVGITQEESEYNGDVFVKNDIKYWLDENGKNSDGEDITEKVIKAIEKNPIKKLKNKPQATTPQVTGSEASASGW